MTEEKKGSRKVKVKREKVKEETLKENEKEPLVR